MLVWLDRAETYLAIIIIGREIAISALREWMAQLGQTASLSRSSAS
jgi:phosphatidylglycerophosphate synthase